jgi:uncharacterized protein (TIGR03435 family)
MNTFTRVHWLANALKALAVFVVLNGLSILLPMSWIDAVLAPLNLGHFPDAAIANYLLRGAGFFALAFGALIWVVAQDVVRHRPVVITLITIFLVGAPAFYVICTWAGLPRWWCVLDFTICLFAGGVPLACVFSPASGEMQQWFVRWRKLIIGATVLVLLGSGFAVKFVCFPTIKNVWFQLDHRQLEAAPANLLIFRETRLGSRKAGSQNAWVGNRTENHQPILRYSGRNLPLQEIIPLAYQCPPSDVIMPDESVSKHYDFLVTVTSEPEDRLRQLIERKTGFFADWQEREAKVWLLKVQTPGLLQASTNSESRVDYKDGHLIFTHLPINALSGFLSDRLKQPLQDATELSGFYDFSIAINLNVREALDENTFKGILQQLGLTVVDGTTTRRMLVVHRK